MIRNFDSSTPRRPWRRVDSSAYVSDTQDKLITLGGMVVLLLTLIAWRYSSKAVWAMMPGGAAGWAMQALCFLIFAGFLWLLDWQVQRKWSLDRFRTGNILGLLAVAGFWIVRLIIWGVVYWIGSKAVAPPA
jgi:hypothetical protein